MNSTICPKCGNETPKLFQGRCKNCFLETFTLAEIAPVLHTKICSSCGARNVKSKWVNVGSLKDVVVQAAEDALFVHELAENIEVYVQPREATPYLFKVHIEADAILLDEMFHQDLETEIRVIRESCDMCSRISGGYFESIMQIRATNRIPGDEEKIKCINIVNDVLERMRNKGDRLAFISNTAEIKEGTDLYLGSSNAGRHICKEIVSRLGGSFTESATLQGRKDGKDVYRVTFSLRLPEFMPHDFIEHKGRIIEIRKFGKNVSGIDVETGARFTVAPDELDGARLLINRKDLQKTILVAIENNDLLVLDPDTYETVTIKKPIMFTAEAGTDIPVIKTEKGLLAVADVSK
ncbi:60S ribosomal export protein NMD3 [Methanolobus psychrotolerans]|uniref:60S ribosomal export protein NMD3 n=1 Tax=Methanolobus psychrotolerans TaxID=1874706 RepID=UPI000B91AD0E|nr:60S ribosomal export protein NMD3 [Methanolobus psychrotolerans]